MIVPPGCAATVEKGALPPQAHACGQEATKRGRGVTCSPQALPKIMTDSWSQPCAVTTMHVTPTARSTRQVAAV